MDNENGQGDQGTDQGDQKIKVGDKEYSAEDIQSLVGQASAATSKSQQVSAILDACKKYDMEPDEFLEQAVGGFTVLGDLIEKGIIDAQGNIAEKKAPESGSSDEVDLDAILNLKKKDNASGSEDKVAALVAKALEPMTERFNAALKDVKEVQTNMIRKDYQRDIMAKYPNLDAEDVSKVFGLAMQDRTKSVWDVAKNASETKAARQVEADKAFCEKHGLNYEELVKKGEFQDENSLKENGPEGGAAALTEGRKITFRTRGVDPKERISPLEATQNYFKQVDSGG